MAPSTVSLALSWALWHAASGADVDSCNKLADEPLSSGFWRPAVIMDNLDVHLGKLRASPLDRKVHLSGLCGEGMGLQSSQFQWTQPTTLGGDWIANTYSGSSQIAINIGNERCALTGLALVTDTSPALRLQFEKCAGRAAIEVPLFSKKSGMKLMPWICGVSQGTDLCAKAAKLAGNASLSVPIKETLDLMPLAEAASKGVLHTNAKSPCFDELHWFVVSGGMGVDEKEWPLVQAMYNLLKKEERPILRASVEIEVEEVCFMSCTGDWDMGKCGKKPTVAVSHDEVLSATSLPMVPATPILSRTRLTKFQQELSSADTGPWLWITMIGACLLGIFVALLLFPLFRYREPTPKVAPRVKQVEVMYPDRTVHSAQLKPLLP